MKGPYLIQEKEVNVVVNYMDIDLGKYAIPNDVNIVDNSSVNTFQGRQKMFLDGTSSRRGSRVGVIFEKPHRECFPNTFIFQFDCTNNEFKYEALIQGLFLNKKKVIKYIIIMGDSELIINPDSIKYNTKNSKLKSYAWRVLESMKNFHSS